MIDPNTREALERIGREYGTPCFAYFVDPVVGRLRSLREAFGGRFEVSFAVKSNPNVGLLSAIRDEVATFDISAIAEADRAVLAGCPPERLTFSGPAKRLFELEKAVALGVGEMVCESEWELGELDRLSREAGRVTKVFLRINPSRMPAKFGVNMAGKPSQFGFDEEAVDDVIGSFSGRDGLALAGFHIYSGTNSLNEEAIAENFGIFIELFQRFGRRHDLEPEKLVFGSGFGIPYMDGEEPLDIARLAELINPQVDGLKSEPRFAASRCVLEMGRWLVGPNGYLVTEVINEKTSRGTEIRMCDAGFNNHLAACGMMGTVIRRNWRYVKLNTTGNEEERDYLLVGPLCTTIDQLAVAIRLPELSRGDLLAIEASGAYGLTASPTRFISHPEPTEYLVRGCGSTAEIEDVTESRLNWPEQEPVGRV